MAEARMRRIHLQGSMDSYLFFDLLISIIPTLCDFGFSNTLLNLCNNLSYFNCSTFMDGRTQPTSTNFVFCMQLSTEVIVHDGRSELVVVLS